MRVFRDARRLTSSAGLAVLLTVLRSLLVMRIVEPAVMGVWKSVVLLYVVAGCLRLSVSLGMSLRVPVLEGEGRREEAARLTSVAGFVLLAVGFAFGLGVFGYSFFVQDGQARLALRLMAVAVFAAQPHQFLRTFAQVRREFSVRSREVLLASVTDFLAGVALAYWFGLAGIGTAMIISIAVPLVYLALRLRPPFGFSADRASLRSLLNVGLPYSLAEYAFIALRFMDVLLMTFLLGTTAVGYYAMSLLIVDFSMYLVRLGVAEVISPHLLHAYGKERSHSQVASFYEVPARLLGYAVPPFLAVGTLILPDFVRLCAPQYALGTSAAQITLWGAFFLAIHSTVGPFLSIAGKMRTVLRVWAAVIPLAALAHGAVMKASLGLPAVALTSVAALGVVTTAELWIAQASCGRRPLEILRNLATLYLPGAACAALSLAALAADFGALPHPLALAGKLALILVLYAPVLALYEMRFSLLREACQTT